MPPRSSVVRVLVAPVALLTGSLVVSGCGGSDDGKVTAKSAATSTRLDSNDFDNALCDEFENSDGPSDELRAALPDRFDEAMVTLEAVIASLDEMDNNEAEELNKELTRLLTAKATGEQLGELAEFVEAECGESEGLTAIAGMAEAAVVGAADADDEYCALLAEGFASGSGDGESGLTSQDELERLLEVAPAEHHDALRSLESLAASDDPGASDEAFGTLLGLGAYSEERCDIDGALAQMLLGALMVGIGGGGGGPTTTVDPADVRSADVSSANAALPSGSGIEFEMRSADLEEDGEYVASVVVPVGWEAETNFDTSFTPPSGSSSGLFTSIDIGAGCDGVCEANDWETRLRGTDGYLSSWMAAHPSARELPIAGSEGVVLTSTADEAVALVLRWDDGADKYLKCEVELDDDRADLIPAFVAACEAARPAWFVVS